METLLIFLLGMIAALSIVPILQYVSDLICTFLELLKSKLNVGICKNNTEMQKIQSSMELESSNAIGFEIPSEYYDDYEEDEDLSEKILNNHIGFEG